MILTDEQIRKILSRYKIYGNDYDIFEIVRESYTLGRASMKQELLNTFPTDSNGVFIHTDAIEGLKP